MTWLRPRWPLLIIASALSLGLLVFVEVDSPLRPWLTYWFMFVCPGMAWVRLLRLPDSATELILGVALSLALDAIVAGVMLYAKIWSPQGGMAALIGISVIGVMLSVHLPQNLRFPGRLSR